MDKRPFSHISAPTTIRLSLNFDIHNPFCILSDFLKQKAPRALMTVVAPNMEVLMLLALNWTSQSLHTTPTYSPLDTGVKLDPFLLQINFALLKFTIVS